MFLYILKILEDKSDLPTVYSYARKGKGGIRSGRVDSDLRKGFWFGFCGAALRSN